MNKLVLTATLCLVVAGCKKDEVASPPPAPVNVPAAPVVVEPVAFAIESVAVGNSIDAEKRVKSPSTTFSKNDTLYASVASLGSSPSVTLKAKWSFKGENGDVLVSEKEMAIAPTGRTVTAFDVAKEGGWPTGAYSVEILVDGVPKSKTEFIVAQ